MRAHILATLLKGCILYADIIFYRSVIMGYKTFVLRMECTGTLNSTPSKVSV